MSISNLDLPDYRDELEPAPVVSVSASKALLTALLAQADTSAIGEALKREVPHVIVLKAPSAAWAEALAKLVSDTYSGTSCKAVTQLKKDGNDSVTAELQRRVSAGRHFVLVSQDPDTLLPASIAGAVDIRLDLPQPNKRLVVEAIAEVSGTRPGSVKGADATGLDFGDLELALREGSSASDCVRRLRKAAGALAGARVDQGPGLEDLPLSHEIRAWTQDLLIQLGDAKTGNMRPADLSYPVLEGPPGTGKSLLASALARSAGWSLVSTSVSEWFVNSDGHLGGVTRAATAFIDQVLAQDCTIGFIDELDALPSRATLSNRDREWWTTVIAQVLLQIDRVRKANRPILLVGATNYYDRLDGALTRAGRLENRVSVLPPSTPFEIERIFAHYLGEELSSQTLELAAGLAGGATPAQIEGWCRTAKARARGESRAIEPTDLLETVAPQTSRSDREIRAVAVHEAGHVALARHFGVKVHGVSILEQGRSGGHTLTETLSSYPNRFELEIMALILLGGRAADMVLGKGGHAGAEMDLDMAGRLIADGISTFGLYGDLAPNRNRDGAMQTRIDHVLQGLLRVAVSVVKRDRNAIQSLANHLVDQRVMTPEAIDAAWEAASQKRLTLMPQMGSSDHA